MHTASHAHRPDLQHPEERPCPLPRAHTLKTDPTPASHVPLSASVSFDVKLEQHEPLPDAVTLEERVQGR